MVRPPQSLQSKQKLLNDEIDLIEKTVDAKIDQIMASRELFKIITVEIDRNSRSTHSEVVEAIIRKYRDAGWGRVEFRSDHDRNETIYWVELE